MLSMFVFHPELLGSYEATVSFRIIRMYYNPEKYIKLQGVMGIPHNSAVLVPVEEQGRFWLITNKRYLLVKLQPSIFSCFGFNTCYQIFSCYERIIFTYPFASWSVTLGCALMSNSCPSEAVCVLLLSCIGEHSSTPCVIAHTCPQPQNRLSH